MFRIEYLKDAVCMNYVGINIYSDLLYPFLEKMKSILNDDYDEYVKYQQERDNYHYHLTIFNVAEFNKIPVTDINKLNQVMYEFNINDLKLMGLGSAEKNYNKAYYVVCDSNEIQEIRKAFNFEEKDLHITLGFKFKDVFGVRKNIVLPELELFLDELKKQYFQTYQTFDFLKELPNYDYDINENIYPIKITNTYATYRIGNKNTVNDFITISLVNHKLNISCKFQSSEEFTYLSDTIVLRKLN
jgi:hypothetical protein